MEKKGPVGRIGVRTKPYLASFGVASINIPVSIPRRAQFPRRSLRELRIDVGKNLEPLVHRAKVLGLERINEDQSSAIWGDEKPIAPPRTLRARTKTAVPTVAAVEQRTSCTSESNSGRPPSERSVSERIENTLHTHYYTIAYTLVIVAYLAGFAEYVYFRLVSVLIPERITYHPICHEKEGRRVGKDGFHYGVSIGAFIAIALFHVLRHMFIHQLWDHLLYGGYTGQFANVRSIIARFIALSLSGFCSFGFQDSLGDTVSTVLMYVFDGVVILYFIAFPLTTVIYHPHLINKTNRTDFSTIHQLGQTISNKNWWPIIIVLLMIPPAIEQHHSSRAAPLPASLLQGIRSQTSTLESNLSQEIPPSVSPLPLSTENSSHLPQPAENPSPSAIPEAEDASHLPPLEPIEYLKSPRRSVRASTLV
uniref:Integral membrane protein n=1 Tax=Angiostrongylus cantonensis TaxID=6313 RepID=A0A158PA36_ANGCA